METRFRLLMEARYIISLNKNIKDLVPLINKSYEVIDNDINKLLKEFDIELYNRVINILERKC